MADQRVIFSIVGKLYTGQINEDIVVPQGQQGLLFMREFVKKNKRAKGKLNFTSGFVGFVSYDLGERWVGNRRQATDNKIPEAYFVFVDEVKPYCHSETGSVTNKFGMTKPLLTKDAYFKKLASIKEYLFAGETYQVNFSVPFKLRSFQKPEAVFGKLVQHNPSSHQFFLETGGWAIISNSPECLFQLSADGKIETSPIKGTAARGKNQEEDEKNIAALLASKKDQAELAMIVDLTRNDLGKVCVAGSIHVSEHRKIELYSHVIHTVSTIEGMLDRRFDWYDALQALFPGGSVTGCPKKRTMEIISELEGAPRGVYCGSAGWIDLSGACDFNILIRTMWYDKKTSTAYFRAGGGIVVDSDQRQEYIEVLNKTAALREALGV